VPGSRSRPTAHGLVAYWIALDRAAGLTLIARCCLIVWMDRVGLRGRPARAGADHVLDRAATSGVRVAVFRPARRQDAVASAYALGPAGYGILLHCPLQDGERVRADLAGLLYSPQADVGVCRDWADRVPDRVAGLAHQAGTWTGARTRHSGPSAAGLRAPRIMLPVDLPRDGKAQALAYASSFFCANVYGRAKRGVVRWIAQSTSPRPCAWAVHAGQPTRKADA
jgi:hypothetical protein